MGLNIDAQKVNLTAVEATKKILDIYPHAWVDDIVKSISMASFGEIVLDNQLSTISASNVFNWYKYFRNNLSRLSSAPPPPENITMREPTLQEKHAMMRKAFFEFINEPVENDYYLDGYYQKLIDIGAMSVTDKEKRDEYFVQAEKMVNAPPYDYLIDRKIRKDLYAFQDYYKSIEDKATFNFASLQNNFIHRRIINISKIKIMARFIKTADKELLMQLFDKHLEKQKNG